MAPVGPSNGDLNLQELLGEDYQVVNLGLGCGQAAEFGEVAAEIFECDHDRVLLVSDLRPGLLHADPDVPDCPIRKMLRCGTEHLYCIADCRGGFANDKELP
jgi:hypothetical protein